MYVCIFIYTYLYLFVDINMYLCTYISVQMSVFVYICACTYRHVYICLYMCLYMFLYTCMFAYRHGHILTCGNKAILCRTRISSCAVLLLISPSPSLSPSPPFPSSLMKWSEKAWNCEMSARRQNRRTLYPCKDLNNPALRGKAQKFWMQRAGRLHCL